MTTLPMIKEIWGGIWRFLIFGTLWWFFVMWLLGTAAHAQFCVGDCNDDGVVTIDELVTSVDLVLGVESETACPSMLCNGPGVAAQVNCVVIAVGNALSHQCEEEPLP